MSEIMDPAKLKVVELRAELSNRGLDTRGNKAALVDRLKEALEKETGKSIPDTSILDTSTEDTGVDTSVSNDNEMNESISKEDSSPTKEPPSAGTCEAKPQVQIKGEPAKEPPTNQSQNQQEMNIKHNPEVQVKTEKDRPPEASASQDGKMDKMEVKEESGRTTEVKVEKDSVPAKTESTRNDSKEESRDQRDHERRGEKRRWSPSPSPRGRSPQRRDNEPDYDENAVLLSWYDSDLNLVIDKDKFCLATPMYEQGFGYIWAGARASHGFSNGRVCFEVKLLENCDVSHLEDEPTPHVLRVGWSTTLTSMQLGEEPQSYGYGGTGKASTDCKFKNYGRPFMVGDVVGAFLDMNSDPIVMSFSVNGESQGVAYEISRSALQGNALYPHVLTKNVKFECNFGNQAPWSSLLPGYTFAGEVPVDERIPGPRRPEKRSDCEMIMMCGLPACGKTTWANEWYMKNLHKNYNILGSNNLIDKMKVMGLPRKRNYAGRWDVLIDRCMKCLAKLLDIAARRRRNYILDQTNVYPSAQRRKMRGFEGFVRRAVVIVPTEEEFKKRIEKQEKVEGKDVPDSAVLEMKANFTLPEKGDVFSEVIYTELGEEEARALVQKYNNEGRDAGYGAQHKRPRMDNRDRDRSSSFRGGFRPRGGGGSGGAPDRNRSGGGWQPRGSSMGGGGGRGGGGGSGGGGWRDRQPSSGGFRSGSSGGSGGGWRGNRDGGGSGRGHDSQGSRGFDRNRSGGSRSRSPSAGSKGSWGGGYNQGGSNWDSASNTSGGSSGWGQQNYNQQGWGQPGGYSQQGYKGGYNQPSGGSYSQGNYNQPSSYGSGSQAGYTSGNSYQNWNQPYYNQYGTSGQGWGGQSNADSSYGGGNYPQQQGAWQGYNQSYNSYGGSNPPAQQGGGGYPK
ncbi:heterogeneous nuclear ribonucleoprotein U-like protein 1 [Anabrus simplex]|uniref:heterogeneous nuclear ribonucleoprotein U-like protein 1 n=1 Tax=Anabrus simplex TaxID=316456 RepID=UPI0035A272C0